MALLPSQLCWRCWDWNSRRQFQHQPGSKPASSPSSPQPPPPMGTILWFPCTHTGLCTQHTDVCFASVWSSWNPLTSYTHSLPCSLWQCQFCHGNTECFHFLTVWHWCFYVSFFSTRSNFNFFHITVSLNSFCYSCRILFYFPVHSSLSNNLIFWWNWL